MNNNNSNWKSTILALIGFTLFTLVVGILLVVYSKDSSLEKTSSEVILAIGISLISASTIGLLTEIFLQALLTKKVFNVETKFLEGIIPKIIQTIYEWVSIKGKKIPIEKSTLYDLLKIGYLQWFMKENFSKIGIPSERVAGLYQKLQLTEFKEPVCIDFSLTLSNLGILPKEIVGRDDLINVKILIEFSAINTSGTDHIEDRFINRNGIMVDFYVDIFENFPSDDITKKQFIDRMTTKFTIQLENEDKPCEPEFIPTDYVKYLRTIKEKDVKEISKIIKSITTKDIEPLQNKIYILYHFFEKKHPEISGFYYIMFCPYPIKPQERIRVSFERTHSFAENDFCYTHLKSLTRGLTVQLDGFEITHETAISHFLLHEEPVANHTSTLLNTSSLLLPRSAFIASWQKKSSSI